MNTATRKPRTSRKMLAAQKLLATFTAQGFTGYAAESGDIFVQVQADAERADELLAAVMATGLEFKAHFHGCWTMTFAQAGMMVPPTRRPF